MISKWTFLLLSFFSCRNGHCQTQNVLYPQLGSAYNYSESESQTWQRILRKYERINLEEGSYDKLSPTDKHLVDQMDEGLGPLTEGPGCSWYCGGQMTRVEATSHRKTEGGISYNPGNLHDFNALTTWVPNAAGRGVIGEKISFHFAPLSPRVSQIRIFNGYLKSTALFKANGRVKTFRLLLDGIPYATLQVADTTAEQIFEIAPVRSNKKGADLILTLEISEIYPGNKHPEVAVSEINFSGLDVH